MDKAVVKELILQAQRLIDEALAVIEPGSFRAQPADGEERGAGGAQGDKESRIVEEIMRIMNTIDVQRIEGTNERMRVQYAINEVHLFNIGDPTRVKMKWCIDVMRKIKQAMTDV